MRAKLGPPHLLACETVNNSLRGVLPFEGTCVSRVAVVLIVESMHTIVQLLHKHVDERVLLLIARRSR
jgi:hypothetical protein